MVGFLAGGVVPIVGVMPTVGEAVTVLEGAGVGVVRVGSTVGETLTVGEADTGVWLTGVDVPLLTGVFDTPGVPGVLGVVGAEEGCVDRSVDGPDCLLVGLDTTVDTLWQCEDRSVQDGDEVLLPVTGRTCVIAFEVPKRIRPKLASVANSRVQVTHRSMSAPDSQSINSMRPGYRSHQRIPFNGANTSSPNGFPCLSRAWLAIRFASSEFLPAPDVQETALPICLTCSID